jgi:hypothetical protein
MKSLRDLTREEKVSFLKQVQSKEIDLKKLGCRPPLFLTTQSDVWTYFLVDNPPAAIILTAQAKAAYSMLQELFDNSITNQ